MQAELKRQPCTSRSDFWNQCSKYFLRDTTRCEENNGQFLTEPTLFTGIGRPPTSVLPRLLLVVASGQTSVTVGRNISEAEFYRGKELTGGRKVSVYLDNLIPSRNNALPTVSAKAITALLSTWHNDCGPRKSTTECHLTAGEHPAVTFMLSSFA